MSYDEWDIIEEDFDSSVDERDLDALIIDRDEIEAAEIFEIEGGSFSIELMPDEE